MPVCPYTIVVKIQHWKGPMFAGASSRHQRCFNGRVPIGHKCIVGLFSNATNGVKALFCQSCHLHLSF